MKASEILQRYIIFNIKVVNRFLCLKTNCKFTIISLPSLVLDFQNRTTSLYRLLSASTFQIALVKLGKEYLVDEITLAEPNLQISLA